MGTGCREKLRNVFADSTGCAGDKYLHSINGHGLFPCLLFDSSCSWQERPLAVRREMAALRKRLRCRSRRPACFRHSLRRSERPSEGSLAFGLNLGLVVVEIVRYAVSLRLPPEHLVDNQRPDRAGPMPAPGQHWVRDTASRSHQAVPQGNIRINGGNRSGSARYPFTTPAGSQN